MHPSKPLLIVFSVIMGSTCDEYAKINGRYKLSSAIKLTLM